jgi:hypothetical protein
MANRDKISFTAPSISKSATAQRYFVGILRTQFYPNPLRNMWPKGLNLSYNYLNILLFTIDGNS